MGTENEALEKETLEKKDDDKGSIYDAVSAAIDEQTITPEEDDPEAAAAAKAAAELEDEEVAEPIEGDDPEAAAKAAAELKDEEVDADGKPIEKDDPEAAAAKAAELEADEVAAAAKELDPVNDPIPPTLNVKTQERIKSLIDIARERTHEASQGQQIIDAITGAGADPDQFTDTLGFLELFNSKDPAKRKSALEVARSVVRELAIELGEGEGVIDLSAHADLLAELEAGSITEKLAIEIATSREQKKQVETRAQYKNEQKTTQQQTQTNIQTGRTQLNDFEGMARGVDPSYDLVRPHFIKALQPVLRRTHPTEWGAAAREVYDNIKSFVPTAAPVVAARPKVEPLRPKGDGGGSNNKLSEPKSAEDAVTRALENM